MHNRSLEVRGQRGKPGHARKLPTSLVLIVLVSGTVLSGCTDEAGGPRFANDPAPTRVATRAVAVASPAPLPTAPVAATPLATPASIGDLLSVRGAPKTVFLALRDVVWAVDDDGAAQEVLVAPEDTTILALDHSPAADRVAVLVEVTDGSESIFDVVVVDKSGEIVRRFEDLPRGTSTPGPGIRTPRDIVDWSPQGDRLLVAYGGGAVVALSLDEEAEADPIALPPDDMSLVNAAWSPTGEAIAFTATPGQDRDRTLWVYDVKSERSRQVVGSNGGRVVVEFAWLPDGKALLFTEAGDPSGPVTGIDLWRIDADGENRQLVASAGTVAPVARITDIQPAPDGRSVAYAVLVPGEQGPRVDSVWVRDLTSRIGFRIALPTIVSIQNLTWTESGLVIAVTTAGTGRDRAPAIALLAVGGNGQVSILWAAPLEARPQGTPVGTPEAS